MTRDPLEFPAGRDLRLQNLARGDEGFLLALGYSTQRGYGRTHPFAGEIRFGEVEVEFFAEEVGFAVPLGRIAVTECQMINQFKGSATEPPRFTRGYGLTFGQSERKSMSMALVDRALRARELGEAVNAPAQDEEFVLSHSDNVQATGFVEHLEAAALRGFPGRARIGAANARGVRSDAARARQRHAGCSGMSAPVYNFAYLDEQTKRMIRRAILKAIAIPGYQVPFASREMPMPYGWGTGGVQVTAAILGPDDVLKVIDQGSDDTTNAVSIRKFFAKTAGISTTTRTDGRDDHPDAPSHPGNRARANSQVLVYQVPIPEPLRFLEPRETETRRMHALADYGVMHVKLYEDIARHGHIATTYAYPVKVDGRYVMDPSPTPKFDNPKMNNCAGAAAVRRRPREAHLCHSALHRRWYRSISRTIRSSAIATKATCALCGSAESFLDEVVTDDRAGGCSSARTPTIARAVARRPRASTRRRPRSSVMLDQADSPDPAGGGRRPAASFSSSMRNPSSTRATCCRSRPQRQLLERFADYPDYTLYVAERGGDIVGTFRAAGDAQSRPSRSAVGDRRGRRGRAEVCRARASARR